jgi:hypothetical protein
MVQVNSPAWRCPSSSAIWIACCSPRERRGLDGIVDTLPYSVFYLSGFNGVAHKADEPRPYAVILSRHAPGNPILVVADYYLATFLTQPTWVEDIRLFRAVMIPLDLPPNIPPAKAATEWVTRARRSCAFDMGTAMRGALKDLRLDRGRGRWRHA